MKRKLVIPLLILPFIFHQCTSSDSLDYDGHILSKNVLGDLSHVSSNANSFKDELSHTLGVATLRNLVRSSQRSTHILNQLEALVGNRDLGGEIKNEGAEVGVQLSEEDFEFVHELMRIDEVNGNILKSYRRNSLAKFKGSQKKSLDSELVLLLNEIAPVFAKSDQCKTQAQQFLLGLFGKQPWALKLVDYSGKIPDGIFATSKNFPTPFGNHAAIGSYQACLDYNETVGESVIEGRHSMIMLGAYIPDSKKEKSPSLYSISDLLDQSGQVKTGLPDGIIKDLVNGANLQWGICSPAACTTTDITDSLNTIIAGKPIPGTKNVHLGVAPLHNGSAGDTAESTKPKFGMEQIGSIIFMAVLALLAALLLAGTVVDCVQRLQPSFQSTSLTIRILKCFSIYTNGKKVLDSSSGGPDHLGCLGGMRTISMMWVILCHSYFASTHNMGIVMNRSYIFKAFGIYDGKWGKRDSPLFMVIVNGFPSVDTFFMLSGLLVAYISFAALNKKRFNIIVYYVHRYIRLTIPMAFAIGFAAFISPYLANGPYAYTYQNGSPQSCRDNWYLNMLYVNNFFGESRMCLGVTWYLAADMQMYWYAPLIILPIWWNKYIGFFFWGLNMAGFAFVQGYLTAHYHLGPSTTIQHEKPLDDFNATTDDYYRTYTRMHPYLMGIMLGYILFKTKGKSAKIPTAMNILLWVLAVGLGLLVVIGIYPMYRYEYSLVQSTIYASFSRIAWSAALGLVIFLCIKGYGGMVDKFLSWGGFTVLSRLTYFTYLIHLDIFYIIYGNKSFTIESTDLQVVLHFLAVLVIAMSCAFVATLCFESPFIGLEKIVMSAIMGSPKPSAAPHAPLETTSRPSTQADSAIQRIDTNSTPLEASESDMGLSRTPERAASNNNKREKTLESDMGAPKPSIAPSAHLMIPPSSSFDGAIQRIDTNSTFLEASESDMGLSMTPEGDAPNNNKKEETLESDMEAPKPSVAPSAHLMSLPSSPFDGAIQRIDTNLTLLEASESVMEAPKPSASPSASPENRRNSTPLEDPESDMRVSQTLTGKMTPPPTFEESQQTKL